MTGQDNQEAFSVPPECGEKNPAANSRALLPEIPTSDVLREEESPLYSDHALMSVNRPAAWRLLFVVGGMLYLAGSSQHPRGPMVEMLAQPAWVPVHATVFVALLILTFGLVQLRRSQPPSIPLNRWLVPAIAGTALEALEMGVHTMAYVDAGGSRCRAVHSGPHHTRMARFRNLSSVRHRPDRSHRRRPARSLTRFTLDCLDRDPRGVGTRCGDGTDLPVQPGGRPLSGRRHSALALVHDGRLLAGTMDRFVSTSGRCSRQRSSLK